MPKFSDSELELVKKSIYIMGRELFIKYGLKKTSVDDIIQVCEIGKGSFYKFYPSKEELYFAILKDEESYYQAAVDKVLSTDKSGSLLMTELIMELWKAYTSNEFLNLFYERKEVSLLLRKLPAEDLAEYSGEQRANFIQKIRGLQKENRITNISPELIEGIIRSVLILSTHRSEIGEDLYEDVMKSVIEFIGCGLGKAERKR